TALPAALNFCRIGLLGVPSGRILTAPLFTRKPPPQEELAADESVTRLSADAISISPLVTRLSLYREIQLLNLPYCRSLNIFAIVSVPALMPSLTINMMFLAFLPRSEPGKM